MDEVGGLVVEAGERLALVSVHGTPDAKPFVAAASSDGRPLWLRLFREVYAMAPHPKGGVVVAEAVDGYDCTQPWRIVHLTPDGQIAWTRQVPISRKQTGDPRYSCVPFLTARLAALPDAIAVAGAFNGEVDFGTGFVRAVPGPEPYGDALLPEHYYDLFIMTLQP
ncbi:MAG: hypothetical protein HYZ28_04285 [Myxococcales bacterium]|nr:hypothetical protein [Myxococcales bacterium]